IAQSTDPALNNHKGGFIGFDNSGRLLIGLGDGGGNGDPLNNAQNVNSMLGKLLRIDPTADAFPADAAKDYTIPPANTLVTGSTGAAEIFAMGLRNPFRGSIDPITGDIFLGDVGQETIEEVDRLPASGPNFYNFGWRLREGSIAYNGGANSSAFTGPVTEYDHSNGDYSITGGVVYRGPVEDLQGQYIFGDFISGKIWSAPVANLTPGTTLPSSAHVLRNTAFAPDVGTIDNIVNFGVDSGFNLLIVDIGGEIFRLEPLP
ncbi:MAG: PQQ-dependent sugar dehydrogenase, partial [Bradyrhizobium sp.]